MNNPINISLRKNNPIDITIDQTKGFDVNIDRNVGGVRSYPPLAEKPSINGNVLLGNKLSKDLGLQDEMRVLTPHEIERILYLLD